MLNLLLVGTLDVEGFKGLLTQALDLFQIVAVVAVIIGLMMSVFKFRGHDMERGFAYLAGVLIAAILIGVAHAWAASLTGVTM